ncbi:MAG TPA: hypothetical protein VGD56_18035 [Gemmatirosa sp.]
MSETRRARPGIGGVMDGVSLAPTRTTNPEFSTGAAAATAAGAPRPEGADARGMARHPVGSGVTFERVEDVYRMDPRRIVLDGPYVRQFVEDADFQRLCAAVALERDIGQHVGVRRLPGPPTDARRVLVYGMRRWKAALHVGLDRVPVRDYGVIGEEKAVELQMLENELRADPHPVDTALGFYLLSEQAEWTQKRIAAVFDKNKGYVSEMVRVGEAIARLREADRAPLYTAPRVTVRAFQHLAVIKSADARREALLALVEPAMPMSGAPAMTGAPPRGADSGRGTTDAGGASSGSHARDRADDHEATRMGRPRLVDESVFSARVIRNGRSFRVRWTDDDLRRDAARIAEEFRERFLEEYHLLLHRAAVLRGELALPRSSIPGGRTAPEPGPDIARLVASAAQDAARVDARIAATANAPAGAPTAPSATGASGTGERHRPT